MKVGVFSFIFQDLLRFEQALDWIVDVGAEAIEIGSGGYVAELGEPYCNTFGRWPITINCGHGNEWWMIGGWKSALSVATVTPCIRTLISPIFTARSSASRYWLPRRSGCDVSSHSRAAPATVTTACIQTG